MLIQYITLLLLFLVWQVSVIDPASLGIRQSFETNDFVHFSSIIEIIDTETEEPINVGSPSPPLKNEQFIGLALAAYDDMLARLNKFPVAHQPGAMPVLAIGDKIYFTSSMKDNTFYRSFADSPVRRALERCTTVGKEVVTSNPQLDGCQNH